MSDDNISEIMNSRKSSNFRDSERHDLQCNKQNDVKADYVHKFGDKGYIAFVTNQLPIFFKAT